MATSLEHSLDHAALIESSAPIAETLERANSRIERLGVSFGEAPADWLKSSDIVTDPDVVRELLGHVCALYKMDNPQVAASFLVLGYFWYPLAGAAACYLIEQRVPVLSADVVSVHLRGGAYFSSPYFFALPDDPDANHPHALVVRDRSELRTRFVRQFEQHHATPFFKTLRSVAPYGINGMRANYLDRMASAILWLCEQLDELALGKEEVTEFVAAASEKRRTGVIEIHADGRTGVYLQRGGCCLNYRLPGEEKCDTCSLRPMNERVELLTEYLLSDSASH